MKTLLLIAVIYFTYKQLLIKIKAWKKLGYNWIDKLKFEFLPALGMDYL